MSRGFTATVLGLALISCSADQPRRDAPAHDLLARDLLAADSEPPVDTGLPPGPDLVPAADTVPAPCPADMTPVQGFCIDRYEAPNLAGADPLVMYSFYEAAAWCQARGKRLCFDDEWTLACASPAGLAYPYGNAHQPGTCNDDKIWKVYSQSKLNGWPPSASGTGITSLSALLAAASAVSAAGQVAADHVQSLYQAEPSGAKTGCRTAQYDVYDLCGNVEEWTRRRDGGGGAEFSGNLKGRYWAEARTCQSGVTTHANAFRFYEIGFRCCADQL